ncbi:hypothetical protein [Streptomyces sp. NBC_00103]|uniref:hypothetical protein n=1 Tax=Streptomyces sp. NBC_00103 TaxID=2975653 RepID=UPI002259C3E0|nr:hypothetical protein [Streptomyces sp. NBC_00103]MCX5373260.1 hypothetical protein [Streptomyces sp. NBC_00103]
MTRRRSAAAAVVLCALLSACDVASGGAGGEDGLLKPTAQPGATARAGGLGSAALVSRDTNGFTVSTPDDARKVRVTQDACAPLAYALSGTAVGRPATTVVRKATGEGAEVTVVLAEYASDQAQQAMDAIATALDECAAGFTATVDGDEHKVGKVAPELAPEGVDQAMGVGATVTRSGRAAPAKAVILRSGNAIAYLSGTPSIPATVLDAQLVKLRG